VIPTLVPGDDPMAGSPLRPVPPVSFHKGMLERLREILFRPSRRRPAAEPLE